MILFDSWDSGGLEIFLPQATDHLSRPPSSQIVSPVNPLVSHYLYKYNIYIYIYKNFGHCNENVA